MTRLVLLTNLNILRTGAHKRSVPTDRAADNVLLKLLNDAIATELICVLRNRQHHFMAQGRYAQDIAQAFLDHADEALRHADLLATRVVQLGGTPDFAPKGLAARSHAEYIEGRNLSSMIRENMLATGLAIESYCRLIQHLGNRDTTTRCLLENILADEEQQSDALAERLVALHQQRQVTWPSPSAAAGHSLS